MAKGTAMGRPAAGRPKDPAVGTDEGGGGVAFEGAPEPGRPRAPRRAPRPRRRRRGRPAGSVRLTEDVKAKILAFIEAGAFDYVAAQAAGIDARTFRDWMARGEGRHPTRRSTPELAAFARDVRVAQGRARAAREIEVARTEPKHWLKHAGRSKPGRDGWTEPVPEPAEPDAATASPTGPPDVEEFTAIVRIAIAAGLVDLAPFADGPDQEGDDRDD